MKNLSKSILAVAVMVSLYPSMALAQDNSLCENSTGYTVAFFNGVWNDPTDARMAVQALQESAFGAVATAPITFYDEPVKFVPLYNYTGVLNGASRFEDLAEVFIQRGEEIGFDPKRHFDIYWDAVNAKQVGFFDKIKSILGQTASLPLNLLDELYGYTANKALAIVADMFSNPPTDRDYQSQRSTLNRVMLEGEKIMMVAHSQGNLFLNKAYDYVVSNPNYTEQNVSALHVAPASSTLRGEHVLANIDAVINGLMLTGINSVPPVTVYLPVSHLLTDPSGHMFIETYLNGSQPAAPQILFGLNEAMTQLVAPQRLASAGSFSATLTWDRAGDVDLHIFEPNTAHVFYRRKAGLVGFLDHDDTTGTGPEHYYASCNPAILEEGVYTFAINNYGAQAGTTATLQISTPKINELILKQLTLGSAKGSNGDLSPTPLVTVTVTKDSNGKFVINAD